MGYLDSFRPFRGVRLGVARSISGVSTSGRFPGHCELVQGRNPATPSSTILSSGSSQCGQIGCSMLIPTLEVRVEPVVVRVE